MKTTMRDIARLAGVSPATVSNALNGRPGVGPESAQEILRIAKEMGYTGVHGAKSVEHGHIRLVVFKRHGLVVMDTQFFMELIESIDRECQAAGLDLLITHIHARQDADYAERIRALCQEQCAGILLLGTEMHPEDLALFSPCASPLVALDNLFHGEKVHAVVMDNRGAGYRATRALYEKGHRRIAHLTSSVPFSNMADRQSGYEAAMRACGLPVAEDSIWQVTPTLEGAYTEMKAHIAAGRALPGAFFAGNDIIAVGAMRALAEKGIQVPSDVSVIGMDDLSICQIANPPLSTIRVYRREMGAAAVHTLLTVGRDLSPCVLKTELSVDLIHRDSILTLLPS